MRDRFRFRPALVVLVALVVLAPAEAPAQTEFDLLNLYRDEISRLVDAPGASRSVAAGRINPAAWAVQGRGGVYFGWEDFENDTSVDDWIGVASLRYLGFAVRHRSVDDVPLTGGQLYDASKTEYTLGLSLGDKSTSVGTSLTWDRGDRNLLGDSRRWVNGAIYRSSWGSLGINTVYDFDLSQSLDQVDLGLRPFGPRVTFFADFLGWYDQSGSWLSFDYDETLVGYGVEVQPIAGLKVGFRADDEGFMGFRVNLGFDTFRPSARYRIDDDGDHVATTYAVEFAPGPDLRDAWPGGGPGEGIYPEISLKGPVTYRHYGWFDDRTRFVELLRRIDSIAGNPRTDGVILNLSGVQMNVALHWELRKQLAGLRANGKKVLVYADRLTLPSYMMATVADELWLDPQGGIDMIGLNIGRSYYADMLEKAGIGFDEWRFFEYKSALEGFARDSFSDGAEEQLRAVLDSFWRDMLTPIAHARGLSIEELERIVDEKGNVIPREAEELGLVDMLGTLSDLRQNKQEARRRPGVDDDVALLGATFGDPVWRSEEWGEAARIAVAYAIGPTQMDSGIRARELSEWLRAKREDPGVAAIVLRADSPGGDGLASELVAREIRKTKDVKPIIVSQGRVAGSGGYWISMDGDAIVASPFTITGSIGVIGAHVYDDGIAERLGIDYDHVQRGSGADLFDGPSLPLVGLSIPHRPATDEERARIRDLILEFYDDFVEKVAEGRGMTPQEVEEIAQGRIWSGTDGEDIGLVDEVAGMWSAIIMAKQAAGLDADDRVQLVEGPELGFLPPDLFRPNLLPIRLAAWFTGDELVRPMSAEADPAAAVELPAGLARIVAPAQWESLSGPARLYLLHLLSAPTQPRAIMEPYELNVDRDARSR